jgi:phosphate transport system protein
VTAVRRAFHGELEQLRLQVELMGVRVDEQLERMREVLRSGDGSLATRTLAGDDAIDAMNVSLTERCYDLVARENPVAGDLRFVMSVLRVLAELERIGDLALRVVKTADDHELLETARDVFDVLLSMADLAVEDYRLALRAWSAQDLGVATELMGRGRVMEHHYERFTAELLRLDGADAVRVATSALVAGRALERIADHAVIIGARVRYLLTGDPLHLASEVR